MEAASKPAMVGVRDLARGWEDKVNWQAPLLSSAVDQVCFNRVIPGEPGEPQGRISYRVRDFYFLFTRCSMSELVIFTPRY